MQQRPSIWLIDDDESTLDIVARAFEKEDLTCELRVFGDAKSFLSEIQQTAALPSLLLVDYVMPSIDGLQLIERLKNTPYTRQLKTVLFSRNVTADVLSKAEQLNAYQVTNKPNDFGAWRDFVRELCTAGFFS